MSKKLLVLLLSLVYGAGFVRAEEHEKPQHGGVVLEVGEEVAHAEVVHDEKTGKLTLYLTGPDAKTALAIKDAPKLNLKTKEGNKQIEMKAVDSKDNGASQYEASDDSLKSEPKGRIALAINGKKFNVDLKPGKEHK